MGYYGGYLIASEFRDGNIAPADTNLEFIKKCVQYLPKNKKLNWLQADSATKSKQSLIVQGVNSRLLHCSDSHEFYNGTYTSKVLGHCIIPQNVKTIFSKSLFL